MEKIIKITDKTVFAEIAGSLSQNFKILQKQFAVVINQTSAGIVLTGEDEYLLEAATAVLQRLVDLDLSGIGITSQLVTYLANQAYQGEVAILHNFNPDCVCITAKGKTIQCKTDGQNKYIDAIKKNEIVFAIGPAGTGKTFLAVAMAVRAFREKTVDRIILTRPAVEAGEKLGFLPGDLQMKVDPYMRPLYDALHELMGSDQYLKNQERGLIEVSPLAYMRGRTLDNAFIILDEAQNTTPEQMKMFLTRIGFNSKVIVTGDITQIDLPPDKISGLQDARRVLSDVDGIRFIDLSADDVVRNGIVQAIIIAYDRKGKKNINRTAGNRLSGKRTVGKSTNKNMRK